LPKKNEKRPARQSKGIAVTIGDPQGIGPEIVLKSLGDFRPPCPLVIVGARRFFPAAAIPDFRDIDGMAAGQTAFLDVGDDALRGDVSFAFVEAAVRMALAGQVGAVVTAPISKDKWLRSGVPFRGHTDYFNSLVGAGPSPAMFFWSDALKVALFTHHVPLRDVFAPIRRENITAFVGRVASDLGRLFGREFTFFFSGLNPHAGENGFLGHEEQDEIIPAMNELAGQIPIAGLFPPDVVFAKARAKADAVVIAWTHDQGLIPFKLLENGSGVQLTLGLPFVRTSPAHGTAMDIAGRGIADHAGMLAALRLAGSLSG
jgi:4-hydroxythreonine-4-phosphate dehydrogenase